MLASAATSGAGSSKYYLAFISATVASSMRLRMSGSLWLRPGANAPLTSLSYVSLRRNEWGRFFKNHLAFISATVASSMRLLKPHSLSYQASALTKVPPVTLVKVASKMLDAGL
jgi:hypothetical protein